MELDNLTLKMRVQEKLKKYTWGKTSLKHTIDIKIYYKATIIKQCGITV